MGWWEQVPLIRYLSRALRWVSVGKEFQPEEQWVQRPGGTGLLGVQKRRRKAVAQKQNKEGEWGGDAIKEGVGAGLWLQERKEGLGRCWEEEWCDLNYVFQVSLWFLWGKGQGWKQGDERGCYCNRWWLRLSGLWWLQWGWLEGVTIYINVTGRGAGFSDGMDGCGMWRKEGRNKGWFL